MGLPIRSGLVLLSLACQACQGPHDFNTRWSSPPPRPGKIPLGERIPIVSTSRDVLHSRIRVDFADQTTHVSPGRLLASTSDDHRFPRASLTLTLATGQGNRKRKKKKWL